jgi:hypothetical protein
MARVASDRRLKQTPDDRKFQELILFICQRSAGDPRFGATKLNKHLFFADFLAYKVLGQSITGQLYFRLGNGPAPRRLLPTIEKLKGEQAVAQGTHDYFGYTQTRTYGLRDPDLSVFSAEEIALVTELIEEFWDRNAAEISAVSHGFFGWEVAGDQEDIPYEVALISRREPTFAERERAMKLEPLAKECLSHHAEAS